MKKDERTLVLLGGLLRLLLALLASLLAALLGDGLAALGLGHALELGLGDGGSGLGRVVDQLEIALNERCGRVRRREKGRRMRRGRTLLGAEGERMIADAIVVADEANVGAEGAAAERVHVVVEGVLVVLVEVLGGNEIRQEEGGNVRSRRRCSA